MAIALVAHPALGTLAGQLGDALPITGLYYPARSRPKDVTLPFFADLTAMLEGTGARVCAFLSPYAGLAKDIGVCLEAGVDVLCAGPVPKLDLAAARKAHTQTGVRLSLGGIHHSAPHFTKAYQQRLNPFFDQPVYLRLIAGAQGPGLLPTWWAVCSQWALALDLLGEVPANLHLSANHQGRAYQVALTAAAPSGAIIQLVIAPQRTLMVLTLLGRGGLISASATQDGVALANAQTTQIVHDAMPPAELAWLRDFNDKKDPPATTDGSPREYGAIMLRGLRQALRQRQPVLLAL